MLTHFDPYMWRKQMRSSFLVALGTNDEFFWVSAKQLMSGGVFYRFKCLEANGCTTLKAL
ncbi:hypothetical protein AU476_26295 [Cupriavidus sp. UYMSc13B]|nr:hypothetical protein AU476_26295 [Cupriavidus sp. UYMSc13B]